METISFNVADALNIKLNMVEIKYELNPEKLFGVSIRKNPKRPFLFTSKVLGKHYPMQPKKLIALSKLLSNVYTKQNDYKFYSDIINNDTDVEFKSVIDKVEASAFEVTELERTFFIGFAETATGLAEGVYNCFKGETAFVNTTRVVADSKSFLDFLEEHSHARQHYLYIDGLSDFLMKSATIALIDDELTTGNTMLNIIKELYKCYGMKNYRIFTILDWRSNEHENKFKELEKQLGINIDVCSLIRGHIEEINFENYELNDNLINATEYETDLESLIEAIDFTNVFKYKHVNNENFLFSQGRFALDYNTHRATMEICRATAEKLSELKVKGNILCIGTGEFIYIPLIISGYIDSDVLYQSTTQSPVSPCDKEGSAIYCGAMYTSADTYSDINFIYNIKANEYDQAFLFVEESLKNDKGILQLLEYLSSRGIENIEVVYL